MNALLMKTAVAALVAACAMSAASCIAAEVPADIQRILNVNGCSGCHSKAQTVVGPSFDAIGAKYQTSSDALQHLKRKVRAGGSGVWGAVPMPPNSGISDGDLDSVLKWVLQSKPS
jgi:cytochrome c